jgi:hypothetical protein
VTKERFTVPLRMFPGNMDVLLEGTLPVSGISLKWDDKTNGAAVILMIDGTEEDRKVWKERGFKTGKLGE